MLWKKSVISWCVWDTSDRTELDKSGSNKKKKKKKSFALFLLDVPRVGRKSYLKINQVPVTPFCVGNEFLQRFSVTIIWFNADNYLSFIDFY